jgi:hypothetical protein
MESIQLLISDASGIYIPQRFVQECLEPRAGSIIANGSQWAIETCLEGPDSEGYWDAWMDICDRFKYQSESGDIHTLYQDGDLWLICYERMTDEEKTNFGFED